jgi:hypothetical protein
MTPHDRPRLAQFLAVLGEAFGEPVSELRAEAYFVALSDLPMEALEQIGRQALNAKFFPRPAELRQLAEGTSEHSAELAWLELLGEVRRVGYMGAPALSEATLDTVRSLWGSWSQLCQTLPGDGPEVLGWAKRFHAAYAATRYRLDVPELVGRAEAKTLLANLTKRVTEGQP